MEEIKYIVHSDIDENNVFKEFNNKDEAIKYANDHLMDQTWVDMVIVEKDDTGAIVSGPEELTIWSYGDDVDFYDNDFPKSDIEDIDDDEEEWWEARAAQVAAEAEEDQYPADYDEPSRFPKQHEDLEIKEAVKNLEEHESEVECKCCFDLFPKEACIKTKDGYICQKCNQEHHSHQGTNLDLIDADPFDLEYDDPRDPEEKVEIEVKEKPVDGNEIRKHEKVIEDVSTITDKDLQSFDNKVKENGLNYEGEFEDEGKDGYSYYVDYISYSVEYKDNIYHLYLSNYHASEDNNAEYPERHTDEIEEKYSDIKDFYNDYPDVVSDLIHYAFEHLTEELNEDFLDEGIFDKVGDWLKKKGKDVANKVDAARQFFKASSEEKLDATLGKDNGGYEVLFKGGNKGDTWKVVNSFEKLDDALDLAKTKSQQDANGYSVVRLKNSKDVVVRYIKGGKEYENHIKELLKDIKLDAQEKEIAKKAIENKPQEEPKADEKNDNAVEQSADNANTEASAEEPKEKRDMSVQNKARENNSKIIKAFKKAGLDIVKLFVTKKDKNGREYKAASPELLQIRRELFGESLEEDFTEDDINKLVELYNEDSINEELKVISSFDEYKPWSGAVDTYNKISDAGKLSELESYLEELYPDGLTTTQINDILWFDADRTLDYLGLEHDPYDESLTEAKWSEEDEKLVEEVLSEHIQDGAAPVENDQVLQGTDNAVVDCPVAKVIAHSEDEKPLDCEMKKPALEEPLAGEEVDIKVNEELVEAKKDEEELPADPEAVKLEVHRELNDLVSSEISAIDEYDEAKAEILDAPIEHKDAIIDTIDHIKDEEKEHVDELIDATKEIPFDKDHEAPVVEEPKVEAPVDENPLDQDFPEVEEQLNEDAIKDPNVKIGDRILIIEMEDEPQYANKEGIVDHIDDLGQIHGTWGGCALIPGLDKYKVIKNENLDESIDTSDYRIVFADYEDDDGEEQENVEYLLKPGQTKGDLVKDLSYHAGFVGIYVHGGRPATADEIKQADYLGFNTDPKLKDEDPEEYGDADDFNESLKEASSAETRAYKNGGKDLDDLVQGKAIARIKDPKARNAAVAAVKAGRPEVAKKFYGDRKEGQAEVAFQKKAGQIDKAINTNNKNDVDSIMTQWDGESAKKDKDTFKDDGSKTKDSSSSNVTDIIKNWK